MNWNEEKTVSIRYTLDGLAEGERGSVYQESETYDTWGFHVGVQRGVGIGLQVNGLAYPDLPTAQEAAEEAMFHVRELHRLSIYRPQKDGEGDRRGVNEQGKEETVLHRQNFGEGGVVIPADFVPTLRLHHRTVDPTRLFGFEVVLVPEKQVLELMKEGWLTMPGDGQGDGEA